METRVCTRCCKEKPMNEFPRYYVNGETLHRLYCTSCKSLDSALWYSKNKEGVAQKRAIILRKKREIVIKEYGGKCACCGESTPQFLSIDHVNGGGGKLRKSGAEKTGSALYHKLIKLGFPKEYQLLCHNCNQAKGIYGVCPHKLKDMPEAYSKYVLGEDWRSINEHQHSLCE